LKIAHRELPTRTLTALTHYNYYTISANYMAPIEQLNILASSSIT